MTRRSTSRPGMRWPASSRVIVLGCVPASRARAAAVQPLACRSRATVSPVVSCFGMLLALRFVEGGIREGDAQAGQHVSRGAEQPGIRARVVLPLAALVFADADAEAEALAPQPRLADERPGVVL